MATAFETVQSTSRRLVRDGVARVRRRGWAAFVRALRLTGAAVAAYQVARWFFPYSLPVLAPLTALLVVQVTLTGMLAGGLRRVVSVLIGVVLAVLFSSVVGLTWWALGILVAVSIIIGTLLRLGDHLLEVPVSAMLVLSAGGAHSVATDRFTETVIGAVVGILVNVLFPPAVQTRQAGEAVEEFAAEIADLLDRAAEEMATGVSVERTSRWLEDARALSRHAYQVDRVLVRAEESRQLNPRALGVPRADRSLRDGLDALEHSSVALRSLFRSIDDAVRASPDEPGGSGDDLRAGFSLLLHELALAVQSFGRLVRAEAGAAGKPEEAALVAALDALREARAWITELLLIDPREDTALWALNGTLLATVERLLGELDLEEHARARERWRRDATDRRRTLLTARAVDRVRSTTRQLADRPQRRRVGAPADRADR